MRPFVIAALLAILVAIPQNAMADERDEAIAAIKTCRNIAASEVRLACLDAATQLLDKIEREAVVPAPKAAAPITPAPNVEAEALARERAELAAERVALEKEKAELARAAEERDLAIATSAEAERFAAEREALAKERAELEAARAEAEKPEKKRLGFLSAPKGLGFFDNDDRPKRFFTNVTRIVVNGAGRHFFETEDGTLWKQVPAVPLTAPSSLPAEVSIRRSASGSRRLAFEEHPNKSYVVVETKEE